MSEATSNAPVKRPRLKFIDMARSIAILLMLEGHFVGLTLGEEYRDLDNPVYFTWHFIRGFTAPMFFTVTGLIFVYLLSSNLSKSEFMGNERVKKGFKRAFELLIWGFLLQINFRTFFGNFHGWDTEIFRLSEEYHWNILAWLLDKNGQYVYAFHVLQCIGSGILLLLIVFGISKIIRFIPLQWWYFIAGTIILIFYPLVSPKAPEAAGLTVGYFPENAHPMLQNIFRGPYSIFPIIPFHAFVMYGGMLGVLIRKYENSVRTYWFPFTFILIGIVLNSFGYTLLSWVDYASMKLGFSDIPMAIVANVIFGRFGQVVIVLGVLILIENHLNVGSNLFLKIGQNTLPVYVLHVILLYSGIIGYGINTYYQSAALSPVMEHPAVVIPLALAFWAVFILLVKYLDPVDQFYVAVLRRVFFWVKKPLTTRHRIAGAVILIFIGSALITFMV